MKKPLTQRLQHSRSIIVLPKNQNHWLVLEDTICKPFRTAGTEAKELALNYARRRAQLINCEINVADRFGNVMQTITRPVLTSSRAPRSLKLETSPTTNGKKAVLFAKRAKPRRQPSRKLVT